MMMKIILNSALLVLLAGELFSAGRAFIFGGEVVLGKGAALDIFVVISILILSVGEVFMAWRGRQVDALEQVMELRETIRREEESLRFQKGDPAQLEPGILGKELRWPESDTEYYVDKETLVNAEIVRRTLQSVHVSSALEDIDTDGVETEATYFYVGLAIAVGAVGSFVWTLWWHNDLLRTVSFACLSVGLVISTLALVSAEQKMQNVHAE